MKIFLLILSVFLASCVSSPLTVFDAPLAVADGGAAKGMAAHGTPTEALFQASCLFEGNLNLFSSLKEGSGLAFLPEDNLVVTHNDSFSNNHLFLLQMTDEGEAKDWMEINPGAQAFNFDWEAIATIGVGQFVVADSGNNWHFRRAIPLYFFDINDYLSNGDLKVVSKLTRLPGRPIDQKNDDVEALFCRNEVLYFCTKEPNGTRMNALPLSNLKEFGVTYPMEFVGTFQTRGDHWQSLVTSADYQPQAKRLALLTYGGVELFQEKAEASQKKVVSPSDFVRMGFIPLTYNQWEGCCFLDEQRLLVSAESGEYQIYRIEYEQ